MELLKEEFVFLDAPFNSRVEVLKEVSKVLKKNSVLSKEKDFVDDVLQREEFSSTAIGYGIAIPHSKSSNIKKSALGFVKLNQMIEWDCDEKVKYIFFIAVPDSEAGNLHIDILANLARKLLKKEFRDSLKSLRTYQDVRNII